MKLKNIFAPQEQLVALDIGSSNIKMLEINLSQKTPRLQKLSLVSFKENVFSNNQIGKTDIVGEAVKTLYGENFIKGQRASVAVPGPAALVKKLRMAKTKPEIIAEQAMLEASSILPGGMNALKVDYHIIPSEGETFDVLLVAVKNEVVESYLNALQIAAVNVAVVDIDYYALNNAFELNYPEEKNKLVAIVDIGARFSSIILRMGEEVLYAGDLSIGGNQITSVIAGEFGLEHSVAESYKTGTAILEDTNMQDSLKSILRVKTKSFAEDLNRQLNLFLGSSGVETDIENIYVTGGGIALGGLIEALRKETGVEASFFNPFRNLEIGLDIDEESLNRLAPLYAVAVGLGLRQAGDRILPR